TVLGLMPLLYEGSNQAEFLKPTVVTLVFGLGFGMLLVLLVVPSVMAMQQDVHRQVQAAKRALRGRRVAMLIPAGLGALGAIGLFAVTVGPVILTGTPWAIAEAVLPALGQGLGAAFAVFIVGLMLLLLTIYVIAALGQGWRRMRA
ncbi:MAG: AcrB/AcrD/AcrF family protein, partial [Pseudomonadota bacterium]